MTDEELTKERDALLIQVEELGRERDSLRDGVTRANGVIGRIQVERDAARTSAYDWKTCAEREQQRAEAAESRLAAIRQRAGALQNMKLADVFSGEWNKQAAVFVYDLTRDVAPAVHPAYGAATKGGRATCPRCSFSVEAPGTYGHVPEHSAPASEGPLTPKCDSEAPGVYEPDCPPAESTTAEAFATVREAVTDCVNGNDIDIFKLRDSPRLLSLLERRMGAMERVGAQMRRVLDRLSQEEGEGLRLTPGTREALRDVGQDWDLACDATALRGT